MKRKYLRYLVKIPNGVLLAAVILTGCGNGNVSADDLWQYYGSDNHQQVLDIPTPNKDKAQTEQYADADIDLGPYKDALDDAKEKALQKGNETLDSAKQKGSEAIDTAKEKSSQAADKAKKKADDTVKKTAKETQTLFSWIWGEEGISGAWRDFKNALLKPSGLSPKNNPSPQQEAPQDESVPPTQEIAPYTAEPDNGGSNTVESSPNTPDLPPSNPPETGSDESSYDDTGPAEEFDNPAPEGAIPPPFELSLIGGYSGGSIRVIVNNNVPYFNTSEYTVRPFEYYSPLDALGRCGTAYCNVCKEIMPTEQRGDIGQIKPSGWVQKKYDTIKTNDNPAGYLYNRCHLIAYSLAGENANKKNLITGTRYFNTYDGMETPEMQVLSYVKQTGNHVLYRVTPVFEGNNLLATGVLMEARSVEDNGLGVQFCTFVYNIQPKITINYATGESRET